MRVLALIGVVAVLLLAADIVPMASYFQDTADTTGNTLTAADSFGEDQILQEMTQFPTAFRHHSSIWDGAHVYTFGGLTDSGEINSIHRYDPTTNTVTVMATALPSARSQTSAVWTGSYAYIFGGFASGAELAQVLRYDPSTDTLTDLGNVLPTTLRGTSAVWTGTFAYLFGGYTGSSTTTDILRFDPTTHMAIDTGHDLVSKRYATAATWDGTHAYIFGGWDGTYYNNIMRYDPSTGSVVNEAQTLPGGHEFSSAVYDGEFHWIFGGRDSSTWHDHLIRFDPTTDTLDQPCGALPSGREGTAAVWTGDAAFITNGRTSTTHLDEILRFLPDLCLLEVFETLGVTLPGGRYGIEGIWHDGAMYIVGGVGYNHLGVWAGYLNEILKFDPAAGTVTKMAATMPYGVAEMALVSDGTYIYIFGGCCGTSGSVYRQALRFDPAADTLTTLNPLSLDHRYLAASWHGDKAYLFGQYSSSAHVMTYDPASGVTTDTGADVPWDQRAVAAESVHDGKTFLFGGCCGTTNRISSYTVSSNTHATVGSMPISQYWMEAETVDDFIYVTGGAQNNRNIYRLDPATNQLAEMAQDLPTQHARFASAVDDKGNIYIVGGHTTSSYGNEIRVYRPKLDTVL